MRNHGLSDPFLAELEQAIEAERFGVSGDQALRERLNELCLDYATELKKRGG
jgi:hypothetical protein